MATLSLRTSASSDDSGLFDSRKAPGSRGIGYPSCNTELALIPPNTADPHGYYAEIGVNPWASMDQIRFRVRHLYRTYHPDTGIEPDVDKLNRVRNIASVLLDPLARDKYNRTPKGMRLMDAVFAAELSKLDDLQTLDEVELQRVLKPVKANPYGAHNAGTRYDYFAINSHRDPWRADGLKAQLWYHFLVEAAPLVNYRRVIKVLMTDGPAEYHHDACMMVIPRSWEPSQSLAYSLFTHVAGFMPGRNDPMTRLSFISSNIPA
ncbi:DnaJ-like chaperonin [Mycobacterium phage DirtMonster]|nr:DnaJ domain protein [Mycobacterium phage Gizmo]YP_008061667.1 DnaJ-like domain protein [Mycobacterium phage Astraea]YP_009012960.1 DNA polymerase III alpha subunit [Mycobacterium phage Dandelion]YP_009014766.1 J domain protein [Mycobacterium phage LinStu]YP_009016639.1 DnaJ domain protein [Mycobacterium phage Nappy]YP_009017509.1 DnaJ domain protein [Mycobacterium phage MoMoMixon]YP_009017951.1 DnaJ-like domain protein [Mycobacterium phage Pleione]YP_009204733.1 hypothetical protein HYRO_